MRVARVVFSFCVGSVIVLTMLVVGVRMFYDRDTGSTESPLNAIEIEYLTPEEAARLLGEDPDRRSLPAMPVAAPDAGSGVADEDDDRS